MAIILVTGGAGFIGSHVIDLFLAAGYEVIAVDDLSGVGWCYKLSSPNSTWPCETR